VGSVDQIPEQGAGYSREFLSGLYYTMLVIRAFEERLAKLYEEAMLRGSLHLCIGQEATAAGGCAALRREDYVTCTYRGHGQSLAKGLEPRLAMAELMGRATGCCKGRGGSMHLTDVSVGLLGENAIVAAGLPLACGAAFSAKFRGSGQVALTFFGEGATNQGVFHEALNLAAAWELPVIFFCENNVYAEMTPIAHEVRVEHMIARAEGNGVPSAQVDGNDVLAVYEATRAAAERARQGGGPTFIEAQTYRLVGHMIGDPEVYRSKGEVEEWRARDPIPRLREVLLAKHSFSHESLSDLEEKAVRAIDDAEAFGRSSPTPDPSSATEYVYA
jgi:acetoin:2,6-dichlorophenolindophenol oxidoreductase subunit alpha